MRDDKQTGFLIFICLFSHIQKMNAYAYFLIYFQEKNFRMENEEIGGKCWKKSFQIPSGKEYKYMIFIEDGRM